MTRFGFFVLRLCTLHWQICLCLLFIQPLCYYCSFWFLFFSLPFLSICFVLVFLGRNHSVFIGLDCAPHWSWCWPLPVGYLINFSVIHISARSFHIYMPFGMCWYSSRRTRRAFYLHTTPSKRSTWIIYLISATGRSMISNWESHLYRSNATTVRRSGTYNLKVGHIAVTVCNDCSIADKHMVLKRKGKTVFNLYNDNL